MKPHAIQETTRLKCEQHTKKMQEHGKLLSKRATFPERTGRHVVSLKTARF